MRKNLGIFFVGEIRLFGRIELQKDSRDLAIEIVTKLLEIPMQRRLHLFALALTDLPEPVILQIGKQRQQQDKNCRNSKQWGRRPPSPPPSSDARSESHGLLRL